MKKTLLKTLLICLGFAFLESGTISAENHPFGWYDFQTELNESADESCVVKKDRVNYGKDEIQITNNCTEAVIVEFDYWTGLKWIHAKYRIEANTTSIWIPAESYKNYDWHWA